MARMFRLISPCGEPDQERRRRQQLRRRHQAEKATEEMSRTFATSSTARRPGSSAAAPENTTARMPREGRSRREGDQDRRCRQPLHDEPPTRVTIQTPALANRPVASSHRNARLRRGANSSVTHPPQEMETARSNSQMNQPGSHGDSAVRIRRGRWSCQPQPTVSNLVGRTSPVITGAAANSKRRVAARRFHH